MRNSSLLWMVIAAAAVGACSSRAEDKANVSARDPKAALSTCIAFLNAPVGDSGDFMAEYQGLADSCKDVIAEPTCRAAFDRAAHEPMKFFPKLAEGCRAAYCPQLSGDPAACAAGTPTPEDAMRLFVLILEHDLGASDTQQLTAAMVTWARHQNTAKIVVKPMHE
jgi:hypothetical protein